MKVLSRVGIVASKEPQKYDDIRTIEMRDPFMTWEFMGYNDDKLKLVPDPYLVHPGNHPEQLFNLDVDVPEKATIFVDKNGKRISIINKYKKDELKKLADDYNDKLKKEALKIANEYHKKLLAIANEVEKDCKAGKLIPSEWRD